MSETKKPKKTTAKGRKIQPTPKVRKSRAKYTAEERKVMRAAAARALTARRIQKAVEKSNPSSFFAHEQQWLEEIGRDPTIYLSHKMPAGGIWEPMRGPMSGGHIKPRTFKEVLRADGQVYLVPNKRGPVHPKRERSAKQSEHSRKISAAAKKRLEDRRVEQYINRQFKKNGF